jgi:hypothetical protein
MTGTKVKRTRNVERQMTTTSKPMRRGFIEAADG